MFRWIRQCLALGFIAAVVVAAGGVTVAQGSTNGGNTSISDAEVRGLVKRLSTASSQKDVWASLTQQEQAAVTKRGLTVATIKSISPATTDTRLPMVAGENCFLARRSFGAYSPVGLLLYTFGQNIKWCSSNGQITKTYDRYEIPTTNAPFWIYRGLNGNTLSATPTTRSVESYFQGKFEICYPIPVGCVQQAYPWIRFTLNANGSWVGDHP